MCKRIEYNFPTDIETILKRIDKIDPEKYARTRNFIDGDITYLSPYISRGVISVKMVKDAVIKRGYKPYAIQKFLQELAWREYWQRIWQNEGDKILSDLKHPQPDYLHNEMPDALLRANTSIHAVDEYIDQLYQQGYMHNHIRMYVASIACNIAKAHWLKPAQWMYYNLLDGDVASNHLSWQWVCGSASSKKYYCNQENINKYTGSKQEDGFLAEEYDVVTKMPVPSELLGTSILKLETILPKKEILIIDKSKPTCIYNSYNLDPLWRKDEDVNRVLLLEPSHFKKYAVSKKVIDFIIQLSKNIGGIILHVGEFDDILEHYHSKENLIFFKEHPAFNYYKGVCDSREWISENISGKLNSFFSFWKKIEKSIR
jgi:deoxyribodipyrimidine photo-lyase